MVLSSSTVVVIPITTTNLAKKEERATAKSSLKSLNARSYIETFFKELESSSYIN